VKEEVISQALIFRSKIQTPQQEAAKLIKLILYFSTKRINCPRALSVSFDHRLTNFPVIDCEPHLCTDFLGVDLPAFFGLSA
jgi:hypothetical protein